MWLWKQNNAQLAVVYGKQCINVYQQIRGSIQGLDRETQKTFLKSVESSYRTLADLLLDRGRLPEAQQVLELLKEQEYFEFVRRDADAAALSGAQIKFSLAEAEFEKQFAQIAGQLAEIGTERAALLALNSRTSEQEKRLSDLETKLESANQAFQKFLDQLDVELKASKPEKNDVATLRETQALMDTLRELDAVALYTIVCADKYRVVLITADIQKAYEYTISEAELNKKVYAFREVLQDPRIDPRPQAQELYRILMGPELARDIAKTKIQTIMWSLDGTLRYLPVAALYDGQKYLVENYRNVVFTIASRDHLKDPVSAKWQALGVGVSREREVIDEVSKASLKFAALPGVREELSGIVRQEADTAAKNGVLDGKVMLDELFTVEALKSSLRLRGGDQPYKLVHIASHFNFQPGDETNSFLLLGDGTLSLARLKGMANLFSKVELLTLSACNTATGSSGEGKEVEGFAVLAQRQGAEAIIATLWPVSDPSTSQLMQHFYRLREAKAGTSKAEALRQAQLALLRGELKVTASDGQGARAELAAAGSKELNRPHFSTDPKKPFAHPYYWAPFILIGNWK
jgi:CHAT domain-containing protein